ncbi:MAG: cytochrome biosis protein, partial [candidate division NC10 bacterium]|nr:cytochrome biosis protein [candidate division NC10 bacterium]
MRAATNFDLEDRVREIASELRCVVCQNLSVADSPSDLAKEMRNLVREQVQQGKNREEI